MREIRGGSGEEPDKEDNEELGGKAGRAQGAFAARSGRRQRGQGGRNDRERERESPGSPEEGELPAANSSASGEPVVGDDEDGGGVVAADAGGEKEGEAVAREEDSAKNSKGRMIDILEGATGVDLDGDRLVAGEYPDPISVLSEHASERLSTFLIRCCYGNVAAERLERENGDQDNGDVLMCSEPIQTSSGESLLGDLLGDGGHGNDGDWKAGDANEGAAGWEFFVPREGEGVTLNQARAALKMAGLAGAFLVPLAVVFFVYFSLYFESYFFILMFIRCVSGAVVRGALDSRPFTPSCCQLARPWRHPSLRGGLAATRSPEKYRGCNCRDISGPPVVSSWGMGAC